MRRLLEWVRKPEVIGHEECPIFLRWTLVKIGKRKLLLHYFLPNSIERDFHDHPWPFTTLVLRGWYDDIHMTPSGPERERLHAPTYASRPALHTHRTMTGHRGCWTIVLTGGWERKWGFWRDGQWWQWRVYEQTFGEGFRCGTDDDDLREADHDRF